jgi:hypothetical protein
MHKLLWICFLLLAQLSFSQRGLLLVQKKGKTIKTYSTGSYVQMEHRFGYSIVGVLAHIKTDTFSILNYSIQRSINDKGFVFFDTLYNGYTYYNKSDIKNIKIETNKSIYQTAEGASYLASGAFTILALVNGFKFKENIGTIGKEVAIRGVGFYALGRFFKLLYKEVYPIGKKYKIQLMQF